MRRSLCALSLAGLCLSTATTLIRARNGPELERATEAPVARPAELRERGALVIVGGGGTPEEALIEALALTGVESPKVLVIPQASSLEDRGQASVAMWREQGVQEVSLLDPLDRPDAEQLLEACDLIWLSGGSQTDLMNRLAREKLASRVARLHVAGKVIGGTSAGAAALGAVMIAGQPDPRSLVAGAVTPYRGLGAWAMAIVDQHFVERERFGRLLTAVLAKPRMLGVGIAERTAVVVQGDDLRVLGEGQVVIYDARKAKVSRVKPGKLQSARDLRMHVLGPGESWTWFE